MSCCPIGTIKSMGTMSESSLSARWRMQLVGGGAPGVHDDLGGFLNDHSSIDQDNPSRASRVIFLNSSKMRLSGREEEEEREA